MNGLERNAVGQRHPRRAKPSHLPYARRSAPRILHEPKNSLRRAMLGAGHGAHASPRISSAWVLMAGEWVLICGNLDMGAMKAASGGVLSRQPIPTHVHVSSFVSHMTPVKPAVNGSTMRGILKILFDIHGCAPYSPSLLVRDQLLSSKEMRSKPCGGAESRDFQASSVLTV